ncbi:MAG: SulP family inorganic anion transporter, partial [Pseudonocardia sp.]|nr:SulP family inorganic anion transporter [Pseudonocardia sp.]
LHALRLGFRAGFLRGIRPVSRARLLPETLAGATLAALAVPEVLGYARIAGMPVVTGLYTMIAPMVVFALLCSSRHLVVAADSATAALLAAGLAGLAAAGSQRWVALAGTVALVVAGVLVLARVVGLGFLANFLSRTVLVGFLTGVGIAVAIGQLGDLLGVEPGGGATLERLVKVLSELPDAHVPTVLVGGAVLAVVLVGRVLDRRVPVALFAVVAALVANGVLGLSGLGVAVLGAVPAGLPGVALPALAPDDIVNVLPVAASMVVVILAQSAATSRAYAARFDEQVDTDADLLALGGANLAAAATGTFVVNGSPTKTQMVVGAGGRSQIAQLVSVAAVIVVCLVAVGLLDGLPLAALAAVVFLIGVDLVDVAGMRRILAVRRPEFVVAVLTALAVVVLGVEDGILVAVVVSIIDHLRHSYAPRSAVLVKSPAGHWRSLPVAPGARTAEGLLVYRFGSGLYFANASRLVADLSTIVGEGSELRWLCLDAAAIGDVDYTAAAVLTQVLTREQEAGVRVVLSNVVGAVRAELDRYGITALVGADGIFDTSGEVLAAYTADR